MLRTGLVITCVILSLLQYFMVVTEQQADLSDILDLDTESFSSIVTDYPYVLVEFYADWCSHCKDFRPIYEAVAAELRESSVIVADVDATPNEGLTQSLAVFNYPTIKLFRNGTPIEYSGTGDVHSILTWVNRKCGPPSQLLSTKQEIDQFSTSKHGSNNVIDNNKLLAYIDGNDESSVQLWFDIASAPELEEFQMAHVTNSSLFNGNLSNTVFLFKHSNIHYYSFKNKNDNNGENKNNNQVKFEKEFSKTNILQFVLEEGFPLLSVLTQQFWERCHDHGFPLVVVFTDDINRDYHMLESLALSYKGRVAFSFYEEGPSGPGFTTNTNTNTNNNKNNKNKNNNINTNTHHQSTEQLLEKWGASGKLIPTAFFITWDNTNYNKNRKKSKFQENLKNAKVIIFDESKLEFNLDTGTEFVSQSLLGKYRGYRRSEEIPQINTSPVFTLVGKQFEDIVYDQLDKDVFILFYAPWCGHCQKFASVWEELAKIFSDYRSSLLLAQMDLSVNSPSDRLEREIDILGLPTLIFFQRANKTGVIYEGERDLNSIKQFILSQASTSINLNINNKPITTDESPKPKEEL